MRIKMLLQIITNVFMKRADGRGKNQDGKMYVSYYYLAAELHWGVCPLSTHPRVHITHSSLLKLYAEWRDPRTARSPMHHHYHHCHHCKIKTCNCKPNVFLCILHILYRVFSLEMCLIAEENFSNRPSNRYLLHVYEHPSTPVPVSVPGYVFVEDGSSVPQETAQPQGSF